VDVSQTSSMDRIDPGADETWPDDVRAEVERLVAECRRFNNSAEKVSAELSLGHVDAAFDAEHSFRALLGERLVSLFHATRLLPHEVDSVVHDGLIVLSEEFRSRRLDRVIAVYGEEIGSTILEALRSSGPLTDAGHIRGRVNTLWGVTPLQPAFDGAGDGMTVFLSNWGGECFYWVAHESPEGQTIQLLTQRSTPVIVEVGVHPAALNDFTLLWRVFAGQLGGWPGSWHEFFVRESIPPERVAALIDPRSPRWPVA
jgi:hypothetical protein